MDGGVSAEHMVLEAGKSPALVAAFQLVSESDVGGEPRYTPPVCRDLAKTITCRAYAPAVMELCHLVNIADSCGGGRFETLFWGVELARAGAFHNVILDFTDAGGWRRPGFEAGSGAVDVDYPDGRFSVSYGRMPFLAALLEFLITTLEYPTLDDLFKRMVKAGPTMAVVSEHANELSRLVYNYLKDNLPSAQNQRKFHSLIGYLEERWSGDFDPGDIDDASVLDFWRVESLEGGDGGGDFRTFQTVFRTFVRLRQTLEAAADLHEIENPRAIGTDRESGEIDPDSLLGMMDTVEERPNPLHSLGEPPASGIKFLNKREAGDLELLMECGRTGLDMPLSLVRCEVFGKAQARITQALRRQDTGAALKGLLDDPATETYEERVSAFGALRGHCRRVLLASLFLLVEARRAEAMELLLALAPNMEGLRAAMPDGPGDDVAGTVLDALANPARAGEDIAALMAEAKKATRGLSRQGFSTETARDDDGALGFRDGTSAVREIAGLLKSFVGALQDIRLPEGDWETQNAADHAVFSRQFNLLYGEVR